jgi:hypothetical protein
MSDDLNARLWSGDYSSADIEAAEADFKSGKITGSAFSSICYTVAGKEKAEGNTAAYQEHLKKAVEASDRFAHERSSLSADELDVRQTILREAKRDEEALRVIDEGLKKPGISTATKSLLLVGQTEALLKVDGEKAEKRIKKIMEEVKALVARVEEEAPLQAIRVYRALARYAKHVGNRADLAQLAQKAQALIDERGAKDQERKLKSDLRERTA